MFNTMPFLYFVMLEAFSHASRVAAGKADKSPKKRSGYCSAHALAPPEELDRKLMSSALHSTGATSSPLMKTLTRSCNRFKRAQPWQCHEGF
jgi:hypothetical protein